MNKRNIIIGINHYYSILHNINYRNFTCSKKREANSRYRP